MYVIRGIDQRGCTYKIGYYKTLEAANKWHDKVTYGDPFWKNMGIRLVETIIEPLPSH